MSVKYYKNGSIANVSDMLIKTAGGGKYKEVECTAAEYEAIDPHDSKTIYVVTYPDSTVKKYLGDEEIGGDGKYHEVECTAAEYEAIDPHDEHTIYIVTYTDGTVKKFLGDEEIGGSDEPDKYYTIERASIVTEEDAETMIVEHEIINVDVTSGTSAIYGNARNKFIVGGSRVSMAATDEDMAQLLFREDIYGAGTSLGGIIIESFDITSIQFTENESGTTVKRYSFYGKVNYYWQTIILDIPKDNILTTFGIAFRVTSINQSYKRCEGVSGLAAIDNENNKYFKILPTYPSATLSMSDNEVDFALGMTERYEVVEP